MKTILISLISEQTIPNILVAAHYKPDVIWFISTKKMEETGKTKCIENVLRLKGIVPVPGNISKVIVDQDSLEDCTGKIESLLENVDGETEYIVNMTGGNKVMALSTYEIFRGIGQRVIIGYMPLGKNEFIQIYPKKKPLKIFEIKERLSLEEYLMAYGFKIQNRNRFEEIKAGAFSRKETSSWILQNYEQLKGVLGFLYKNLKDKRDHKNYPMSATFERDLARIEREFLAKHGFEINDSLISKDMIKDEAVYLTGGWFEEYVYNVVYDLVQAGLLDDAIMGLKIENPGGPNELDIAFMKENVFYYIECKTLGEGDKEIIRDEIYKKGAISTLLGKGAKRAIICTTQRQIKESDAKRGEAYDMEVLTLGQVWEFKKYMLERFGMH